MSSHFCGMVHSEQCILYQLWLFSLSSTASFGNDVRLWPLQTSENRIKSHIKKAEQILGGVEKAINCWNIFILMLFNSGRRLLARHQTESLRFFLLLLWTDFPHQPTHCIVYQFMGTLQRRSHFKFELEHETPITSLSPYVLMISSDPLWDGWLRLSLSISFYSLAKHRNQSCTHIYCNDTHILKLLYTDLWRIKSQTKMSPIHLFKKQFLFLLHLLLIELHLSIEFPEIKSNCTKHISNNSPKM